MPEIPKWLLDYLMSLTEEQAGELYDWIDNEPHAVLIIQYHIGNKFPKLFEIPPEYWTLMNDSHGES